MPFFQSVVLWEFVERYNAKKTVIKWPSSGHEGRHAICGHEWPRWPLQGQYFRPYAALSGPQPVMAAGHLGHSCPMVVTSGHDLATISKKNGHEKWLP